MFAGGVYRIHYIEVGNTTLLGMKYHMAMSWEINPFAAVFAGNLALSCCKVVDPLNAEHQLRGETGNAHPVSQQNPMQMEARQSQYSELQIPTLRTTYTFLGAGEHAHDLSTNGPKTSINRLGLHVQQRIHVEKILG